MDDDDITRELEAALAARDAAALRRLLSIAGAFGWSVAWAPVFAKLIVEPWHAQQEELASALQDLRDPASIDALFAVAHDAAPYSDVDDGRALARKCVWALHDIGTPAAQAQLARLTTDAGDAETRRHATKKLAELAARAPDAPPEPYRIARDRKVRR